MGYGVVKLSLGKTMIYVRWLAITHFVFGVIYSIASLSVTPENAGPLVLLVVLPLAATLTAFYVWTLNSLNFTLKDLLQRKQTVKAAMYKKLWWCILASIIVIFAFFFVNSWTFAGQAEEDFVPNHWSTRWFILDGWLNMIYFADVAFVAYIWRPTANNRRFAMSDEVSDCYPFQFKKNSDSRVFPCSSPRTTTALTSLLVTRLTWARISRAAAMATSPPNRLLTTPCPATLALSTVMRRLCRLPSRRNHRHCRVRVWKAR
jgi:hypothetical protein